MEHLATFGLSRDPFVNEPRLATWFDAPSFQDAHRRLERAAMQNKGLCLVTAPGGAGKTMLVRHLLEALEEEAFEACMLVPIPGISDTAWVLNRFAAQLGVEEPAADSATLLGQIYEQLAIVREDGRTAVLIVDEAQVLADQGLLAQLRGLMNLEYEDRRLLTLVLVGLPSLAEAIDRDWALKDRLDLRMELPRLDEQGSVDYLRHRIRGAGGSPAILESAAVAALVKWGEGIPRRLNTLADNALFEAHVLGRVSAAAEDVERAAAELKLERVASPAAAVPARGAGSNSQATESTLQPEPAPSAAVAPAAPAPGVAQPPVVPVATPPANPPVVELSEVVAAATDPRLGGPPDNTAMHGNPFHGQAGSPQPVRADATVIFSELAAAPAQIPEEFGFGTDFQRAAPAETVALLDPDSDSSSDLDDLFADLVDD